MANISEDSVAYGMHAYTSAYMTAYIYTYTPIYIYIDTLTFDHTYLHRRREQGAKTREQGKCSVAAIMR